MRRSVPQNRIPHGMAVTGSLMVFLFGCLGNNPTSTVMEPDIALDPIGNYRVEGGDLIVERPARQDRFCGDGEIRIEYVPAQTDTLPILIRGDTLFENVSFTEGTGGARFMRSLVHLRISGGPGLKGRWLTKGFRLRLDSGSASDSDRDLSGFFDAYADRFAGMSRTVTEFADVAYASGMVVDEAALTVWRWNNDIQDPRLSIHYQDSAHFAISIRRIDPNLVEYKGLLTGEMVLQSFKDQQSTSYSSSNPSHPAYTLWDVTACPTIATWFQSFKESNRKKPDLIAETAGIFAYRKPVP